VTTEILVLYIYVLVWMCVKCGALTIVRNQFWVGSLLWRSCWLVDW